MATDVERLSVLIEANTKSYERAMVRVEQQTAKAIRNSSRSVLSLNNALSGAMSAATRFAGVFGVGLGLTQMVTAVRGAVTALDDLGDAATRAGVSGETLQILRFQLEQNEGKAEDADSALQRLNKSIGQVATTGKGPAAEAFKALGISVRDTNGHIKSTDTIFQELVARFGSLGSGAQAAALAAQIFGREVGSALAPSLMLGAGAFAEAEAQLRSLNGLMSQDALDAADKFDKRFKELFSSAAWQRMAIAALTAIEKIGQAEHFLVDSTLESMRGGPPVTPSQGPIGDRINSAFQAAESNEANSRLRAALNRRRLQSLGGGEIALQSSGSGVDHDKMRAQRAALEAMTAELQKAQDRMQEFGSIGESVLGGLIRDFQSGKSAAEAMTNALSSLTDQLLSMALNTAFGALFGGGLSPGARALGSSGFAGLFAEGGRLGPNQWGIAGEDGPEIIRGPATIAPMRGGGTQATVRVIIEEGPLFRTTIRGEAGTIAERATSRGLQAYDRTTQRRQLAAG